MAQEILNKVLNNRIMPKQIIRWLTDEDYKDPKWLRLNEKCQKEEFIAFFLNYMRDQFTSVLQASTIPKQAPAKTPTAQPKVIKTIEPTRVSGGSRKINPNFDVEILNDVNDQKKLNLENHASFPQLGASPVANHSGSSNKSISYSNMCKNTTSTPVRQNSSNSNKDSTKNNQTLNTSIMNNANDCKNITGNISSPQSNASPIEVCSSKKNTSYSNMCKNTSTSNNHNTSNINNETPKNNKGSKANNKNSARGHKNSPHSIVSPQQNSSPIEISSESPKTISYSNICKSATSTPIRRNPTRITTDEKGKGNKENTVFGAVLRPFTQNPQFVNVSPIDKSVDNESFKIERGLVKMERQKKPEPVVNSDKPVNIENNQPRIKILQRTPSKVVPTSTIVIPTRVLVENVGTLDILAELYSEFLNHNLILNPMTELYFIIQLITTQYTTNVSSDIKNVDKTDNHNKEVSEEMSSTKTNLSLLRKSLNFDDSLENIKLGDRENSLNKSIDELGCLSIDEDSKEGVNLVNLRLKEYSLNNSNVISETSFEDVDDTNDSVKLYLQSPHNCVYFSTQVLNHQKAFLECLDRVTLKLLCENNQISTFIPELCKYLNSIYSNKVTESQKCKSLCNNIGSGELNVCFQIDTDNRENFPSSVAFQNFRKQRDMFYEILKVWEDNHSVPGWTFQIALSGKIKSMLSVHVDVTNVMHFSRLFKSQMLMSCIESGQQDLLDDETESVLKNLKVSNPEKLNQLQRKLVTPLSQNGPVPLPSFSGIQEFYKDFILYASNQMFYVYLEDTFISEIMELTSTKFAGSDIEETETDVDEQTKQNFVICSTSLRLLSKFLGFITSLPYRSETSMLPEVINSQVSLRSKCLPRIDLLNCLQTAAIEGKLTLIVPWTVEYLSMMDHASLRLPYYKRILEMLYCIYRAANYYTVRESSEFMSQRAAILIKLAIGWLFELPHFPRELYYTWQSKYSGKTLKMICDTAQVNNITECSINEADTSVVSVKHSLFLDKLQMIDDRILYSCCPYLKELNILLTPGNSNVNSSISCKHVTPVTSQLKKPIKKANIKHLEIQLEEAFFHGQPMSTRKTVEYISERVASSCVKYICNNILPVERQNCSDELKKNYEELKKGRDTLGINSEQIKKMLSKDIIVLSAKAAEAVKVKTDEIVPKMCESRVTQSIESLLAEDCLVPVKNMCAKIAVRMALERIDQWMQSHISGGSTFIKNLEIELDRGFKNNDEDTNNRDHNPNVASPTDIIHVLRTYIWNLLETKGASLTMDGVSNFWDQLFDCFTKRADLKSWAEKSISYLSIDFCLLLMTCRTDLFTSEVQNKIIKAWKVETVQISEPDSPLLRILSPRNIMILSVVPDSRVWMTCGKFLKLLLKENILPIDSLSQQAVSVFRNEWPVQTMKNLSTCLKEAIDSYHSSDEETERIRYLLGWVAGAYNDMDLDSFGTF